MGNAEAVYMDLYQSDATSVGAYTMPVIRPHSEDGRRHPGSVMVKTNFMKEDGRPCQLRFNELKTLFHELGHALHDLFQDTRYRYMLAPHNDDCRELPSMFMEKWASVPEVIVPFARHCQTGEPMPESLVRRLKSLSGPDPLKTLSTVGKSLLDMEWYSGRDHRGESIVEMEKGTSVYYREFEGEDACISTTFTHIFGGGYAGQYFVYLWSDVISADAYAVFKEENSLRETGERFRREFLSKGSATRSLCLYENFAGHAPGTGPFVDRLQSKSCD